MSGHDLPPLVPPDGTAPTPDGPGPARPLFAEPAPPYASGSRPSGAHTPGPYALAPGVPAPGVPAPDAAGPAPYHPVPRPPAPPSSGIGWTIVALLSWWPFGLWAYPHTQRATLALATGDLEQASAEAAKARRAGITGLVCTIVVSLVLTVAMLVGFVALVLWGESRLGPPESATSYVADNEPGSGPADGTSVWELREGDCYLTDGLTDVVRTVAVVPCDEPHGGELYEVTYIAGGALREDFGTTYPDYPGDPWMAEHADEACRAALAKATGGPADGAGLHVWHTAPDAWDWRAQDRRIACLAESETDVVGPVGDHRANGG
ncbi:septum formation family protein [Promicromonospora sp. MS192]|uniref:septum formation family protein n=1 Tax=Promicromonospora sp. MS192 TaxID=3412684 RepID=UPI003C2D96B9